MTTHTLTAMLMAKIEDKEVEIKKLKEALRPFAEQSKYMGRVYATESWMAKKADYINAYNLLNEKPNV